MEQQGFFWTGDIENSFIGHILSEIYRDRIFDPFVTGRKDLQILDIGANIGLTTYFFSRFAKQIYSLEPSIDHFSNLTKMIQFNNLKNVTPVNKAIFMKSGKYPLFHNKNKTMYSLHQAVHDNSSQPEEVETITLTDLFKEYKIDHIDIMKLDIEGSEIEIVSHSAFLEVAPKIDTIVTERHAWSGRNPNQLDEALKMAGYKVSTMPSNADIVVAQR